MLFSFPSNGHNQKVHMHMVDLMSSIICEGDTVSQELLDTVLVNLVPAHKVQSRSGGSVKVPRWSLEEKLPTKAAEPPSSHHLPFSETPAGRRRYSSVLQQGAPIKKTTSLFAILCFCSTHEKNLVFVLSI